MKSKWNDVRNKLVLVEAWARDGLTDKQISHNLGISESTLNQYKLDHPEFSESLKRGKEIVDVEVENALLKKAIGFEYEETEELIKTVDGRKTRQVRKIKKYSPPDTTAQIFWLKNRRPDKWRDGGGREVKMDEHRIEYDKRKQDLDRLEYERRKQHDENSDF